MKTNIQIRAATQRDLPLVCELDQKLFGCYGGEEEPEILAARLQAFPDGCRIFELPTGETVGCITTEKWQSLREPALNENPFETHDPAGTVLNITALAIDTPYQGQGFGGQVLYWLEQFCVTQQCSQIVLETANARAFYERHGYTLINERNERGYPLYVLVKAIEL